MKYRNLFILILIFSAFAAGCFQKKEISTNTERVRQLVDTVGFAQYSWQMDSLIARLDRAIVNDSLPMKLRSLRIA